ncbi:MAG: hypothetical protein EXR28_09870 [Betaproteobacteria bacterium]|nr:hypothetical protein [Betaproteobacteria bacterium]
MRGNGKWTFIETSEFQNASKVHLSDVEIQALKELIPRHPEKWIELKDSPGLFALHWGVKSPVTIVFIVSPKSRKVYLLGIEPGRHYSVTEEVKKRLPAFIKKFEGLGIKVAAWFGVRQLIKWIADNWPF